MRYIITIAILITSFFALNIAPPNYSGKVHFIKQVEFKPHFQGFKFSEISGLAYDKNKKILYMVSDKGILYTFKATFTPTDFKLEPLKATYFKRKSGKRFKRRYHNRDTEGIALDDKGNIYVCREGKPRVTQFSADGVKIKNLKLPKKLRKIKEEDLQSGNKSLESLTWHPKYGLITALELPDENTKLDDQTIYSFSGKSWKLKMEPYKKNGISEIEVMDDGNLLILERAYNGLFGKFVVTLKKLYIQGCKKEPCKAETILSIDSAKDWYVENFEGLARVGKNRYLMISDDNNNFFQRTLLIYFEIE
jgi:hypothetical protein